MGKLAESSPQTVRTPCPHNDPIDTINSHVNFLKGQLADRESEINRLKNELLELYRRTHQYRDPAPY